MISMPLARLTSSPFRSFSAMVRSSTNRASNAASTRALAIACTVKGTHYVGCLRGVHYSYDKDIDGVYDVSLLLSLHTVYI